MTCRARMDTRRWGSDVSERTIGLFKANINADIFTAWVQQDLLPNLPTKMDIHKDSQGTTCVTVSPGITARTIEHDPRLLGYFKVPVDLGIGSDKGIAEIIGYIANNAAGTGAAFHGRAIDMTSHVRAIKAGGSIWTMETNDPHLTELIGMGGTTGLITEATIKLTPVPTETATTAVRIKDISKMYDLLEACKTHCWEHMHLFERMNNTLFQQVVKNLNRENHSFTQALNNQGTGDILIIQLGTRDQTIDLSTLLSKALQNAGLHEQDIRANTKKDQDFMLQYRVVNASTTCDAYAEQTKGKVVGFDISIPPGDTNPFPSTGLLEKIQTNLPGIQPFYFGHAAGVNKINRNTQRGGMIVSEHTLGTKLVSYAKAHTPKHYQAALAVKKALDPQNLLNPGAFFDPADIPPEP